MPLLLSLGLFEVDQDRVRSEEGDHDREEINDVAQIDYVASLKAVINGFRAGITGAAGSWFVIGGMCPEVIASYPGYPAIRDAIEARDPARAARAMIRHLADVDQLIRRTRHDGAASSFDQA